MSKAYTPGLDAMKADQNVPIKAHTPGLDAMKADQNVPIKAHTPGLDAMKAKQATPLSDEIRSREEAAKKAADQRSAENKAGAKADRTGRRVQRELKRAEITGRVSNFLRDWATKNSAVNQAVNTKGSTVNVAQLPGIGALNLDSGKLMAGPMFAAPTSSVDIPRESDTCAFSLGSNGEGGVQITAGYIGNQLPPGFDISEGKDLGDVSGDVWAEVEIDDETGGIDSVDVGFGGHTPQDSNTKFHLTLGNVGEAGIRNFGCGSIYVRVCRNWFAAAAPFYGVNLNRG